MALGRMISRSLSTSERYARLHEVAGKRGRKAVAPPAPADEPPFDEPAPAGV